MDQPSITSPDLLFSEKISGFKKRNKILVKNTTLLKEKQNTYTPFTTWRYLQYDFITCVLFCHNSK